MQEKKEKKQFVEPALIKHQEPLDKVTMAVYGGGGGPKNSSSGGGDHCSFIENLFFLNHCTWD